MIRTSMARTCCGRNGSGSAAHGSTATQNEVYDWTFKFLLFVDPYGPFLVSHVALCIASPLAPSLHLPMTKLATLTQLTQLIHTMDK